jgi:hypothetical protein
MYVRITYIHMYVCVYVCMYYVFVYTYILNSGLQHIAICHNQRRPNIYARFTICNF